MQHDKIFAFNGILERVRLKHDTTAVFLPHHIIIELPKGRQRVTGIINNEPFSLSIQFRKDGSRFFTVGSELRMITGLEAGDPVQVSFRILDSTTVGVLDAFDSSVLLASEIKRISRHLRRSEKNPLADYVRTVRNLDCRIRKSLDFIQRAVTKPRSAQPTRKNKNK